MKMRGTKKLLLTLSVMALCMIGNSIRVNAEEASTVTFQGQEMDVNTTFLDCNNMNIQDFDLFVEELQQFPKLEKVELLETNLSIEKLRYLSDNLKDIKFVWKFILGNFWTVRTDMEAFSLNKGPGPYLFDEDMELMKYCTDMVALDLGHCRFTDISFVKYMPKLRCVIFSDGRVSDISPIAYCKDLVRFEAWFCPVQSIEPLKYLVNLKDVNVSHCRSCSDITPLLNLPRIEAVYMSYCNVPQDQIDLLRKTFPNADIEMSEYYAYAPNWRKMNRYYEMRNMYKTNTVSEAFMDDYDRLAYFERVFDYDYYKERYPQTVKKVGDNPVDLLYYFLNVGVYEQQKACEDFDIWEYMEQNPQLRDTLGRDYGKYLSHYLFET